MHTFMESEGRQSTATHMITEPQQEQKTMSTIGCGQKTNARLPFERETAQI